MKRTLINPVFLACLFLASANQLMEKGFGVFVPIVHSYLDDILCFPIVLTIGLAMYRFFKPNYRLTLMHMLPVLIAYSIYFEWYLPNVSANATFDPIDVLMYLIGLVVFSYFINRNDDLGLIRTNK